MKRILSEGVYDPGIFKAIFLAGGPGSGKSTAVRKMVFPERYGLKNVNVDTLFEMLLKKADVSMDMTGGSPEARSERMRAFNRARGLTKKQQMNFIDDRLGMVIDGTGGSFGVISKQKKQLEDLGYDTFMIFVDTTLDTAVDRNIKRGEKGGRRLRDKDLVRSWNAVSKNKEAYIDLFGDNIVIVDGNKFDQKEIAKQSNVVRGFIEAQPTDSEAKSWIANELRKKDLTVSESQIHRSMIEDVLRRYVRELLVEQARNSGSIPDRDVLRHLTQIAADFDAGVDSLDVERAGNRQVNESFLVTAYGTIISASGLAKLLGYTAKGIAIGLKKLGVKGIDPEKEGQTFFRLGDKIHHLYLGVLKKLAGKMGVPPEKRALAANVMFGVLLGAAMTATGIELVSAIKGSKLGLAIGEGGMAGIKIGEGAEIGADIFTLVREAFEAVPELAGMVVDVAETAEEAEQAIKAGGFIG